MSVSAIEPTTGLLASITSGASATAANQLGKDTFLELLVAQLRYQDPMNPTDSAEFLAQSAQFTALEKMQSVADQTAALVAAQMAFGASSLVGRTVTWPTDAAGTTATGVVQAVRFDATGPVLVVDGADVALTSVTSVTTGTTTPGTNTTA
jgi:flagellar basal-body rod modification protein FlgD